MIGTIYHDMTWHNLTWPSKLPVHKPFEKMFSLDYPYITGMELSWHWVIWTVVPQPIQDATLQGMIPTLRVPPVENWQSLSCIYASYRYHHWRANKFDAGWPDIVYSILIEEKVRTNQEDCRQEKPFWNWTITQTTRFGTCNVAPRGTLARGLSMRLNT